MDKNKLIEKKTVEVGNIFTLGTRFSDAIGLFYDDEEGNKKPVFMGSYGIGLGRLMGVIAEVLSDDKGLVWPKSVAPFEVHLIALDKEGEVREKADQIYEKLTAEGIEVLYDDRDVSAGQKFGDAELIGIPKSIVVGKNSLKEGKVEVKNRATGEVEMKEL
jgi:prolyl-tRNA synthetase